MCLLFETIRIENGRINNINYHNTRLNLARKELFGCSDNININDYLKNIYPLNNERTKCKIIYNHDIQKIEFSQYQIRTINSLKIIHIDECDYRYKFVNRSNIDSLLTMKFPCDEIIICVNNRLTDTSFTNIAFFDGEKWFTPKFPLLKGTQRQFLLDTNQIFEKDIFIREINNYLKIRLFNAMITFNDKLELETSAISV